MYNASGGVHFRLNFKLANLDCKQSTSALAELIAKITRVLYSGNILKKRYSDFLIRMNLDVL